MTWHYSIYFTDILKYDIRTRTHYIRTMKLPVNKNMICFTWANYIFIQKNYLDTPIQETRDSLSKKHCQCNKLVFLWKVFFVSYTRFGQPILRSISSVKRIGCFAILVLIYRFSFGSAGKSRLFPIINWCCHLESHWKKKPFYWAISRIKRHVLRRQ